MKPGGEVRTATRPSQLGLGEAVSREREAASRLATGLGRARAAAARLDVDGLRTCVAEARLAADDLARAGAQRMRVAGQLVRSLDVASDTPLERLAELSGEGGALAEAAGRLRDDLHAVARESSALGICLRYGGAVAGHLAALAGRGACYGPGGRLTAGPRTACRRV